MKVTLFRAVVQRTPLCVALFLSAGPPGLQPQDPLRPLNISPTVRSDYGCAKLEVTMEMHDLSVRDSALRFDYVIASPGIATINLGLMTVIRGATLQLANGHPIRAPLLATIVHGAILELAFEAAGT